jgi:hypothetical protein
VGNRWLDPQQDNLIVKRGERDTTFAARFRAYGRREYVTLGRASEGMNESAARAELDNILADVGPRYLAPARA